MDQAEPGDAMLAEPIPLANVNAVILRKVISWCQHHKDGLLLRIINENLSLSIRSCDDR